MIFNSVIYENSMPQGMGVLEIADPSEKKRRLFIPLTRTEISGTITGPLASLQLTQVFSYSSSSFNHPIEAVYRFPLPGDALITGAEVSFGDELLKTSLKERDEAKDEYHSAFEQGRKGILLTRETADIFTLHLTGIEPDQPVTVSIQFLQYGVFDEADVVFRVPLTLAPRYIRDDERFLGQRNADPLLMLIDPGHTFELNLLVDGRQEISCPSHQVQIQEDGEGIRVTLKEKEVRPDRDFILTCRQPSDEKSPLLTCQVEECPDEDAAYLLATITPPKKRPAGKVLRELIILVDHSGSMEGPKWQAADWTVKKLLKTLQPEDAFALGVFHTESKWLSRKMSPGTEKDVTSGIRFLEKSKESGGTELGKALEEGLSFPKSDDPYIRHIIIITDAEVSDEGRLIRMVRDEQQNQFPRRVSVICIDAAPNTPLVRELVRVGHGIARFLTSEPEEQDITTALEKVLAFWEMPKMRNLSLMVNRDLIHLPDGEPEAGSIPIPSLSGSLITLAFQVCLAGEPLDLRLIDQEGGEVAAVQAIKRERSGIRECFGSARIRMLEQIRGGFYKDGEVRKILSGLGYTKKRGKQSLYPEKDGFHDLLLDEILVHESLRFGVPSALTAFVCTSERKGTPVKATVVVPSAYPSGWREDVCYSVCASPMMDLYDKIPAPASPPGVLRSMAPRIDALEDMCIDELQEMKSNIIRHMKPASIRVRKPVPTEKEIDVVLDTVEGGILFDGGLAGWTKISGITVLTHSMTTVSPDVKIDILLNSGSSPVASISLIDLLDGDIRPLNIRLKKSDRIILKIWDPRHEMQSGIIRFEIRSG